MKISIIIPTHNEGPDLDATVALCRASVPEPHEIIVVDDQNDPPVPERFPDVTYIRSPTRLGAGPAKRFGCENATGDAFILLDSHMRMPMDWLDYISEAIETYPNAIFCTCCRGFEVCGKFIGSGAEFSRGYELLAERRWLPRGSLETIDRCPCLLGACYIVPRTIWDVLRGINPNFYGWGYGEQDLSFRAWLLGFEVRRINRLVTQHHFDRHRPKSGCIPMSTWHNTFNALVTAATIFEDNVFERLFKPFMYQVFRPEAIKRFEENLEDILKFRHYVQDNRVYEDVDLEALCGYRMPTIRRQQIIVDKMLQERQRKDKK